MESKKQILRQYIKHFLQKTLLPVCYWWGKRKPVNANLALLADSNCDSIPDSMRFVRDELLARGYDVEEHFCDFSNAGLSTSLKFMMKFMVRYAQAGSVFVCNYFVPCTACQKRDETKVIQLWHSCGALKKFGYDAPDDISAHFKGSVSRNFDYYTVSSEYCVPVFGSAFRLKKDRVKPIGVSRTDEYFQSDFAKICKDKFYKKHPEYKGKKLLLYAPTFRGVAGDAYSVGEDEILKLKNQLGDNWVVLIKMHPRVKSNLNNCDFPTNELFAVVDILISDYSSLIFEYALFRKPLVLWVPDLDEYTKGRDFYLDFENDIPCPLVKDGDKLFSTVVDDYNNCNPQRYDEFINKYMSACDGHSTKRIIDLLEI